MNFFMTASAEAHQVAFIIRSAFGDRFDVMHFLYGNVSSVLQTLLAERVLLDVACSYLSPLAAVPLVSVVAAGEVVVVLPHLFFMSRAVLLAIFSEVAAAWVTTGTLWFPWHDFHFLA